MSASHTLVDPEERMTCPYDNSHSIRVCKMAKHLTSCRVNHPQREVRCIYDSTHVVQEAELQRQLGRSLQGESSAEPNTRPATMYLYTLFPSIITRESLRFLGSSNHF